MYVSDFLSDDGYPSIETTYQVVSGILDGITTEALDLRFRTRLANTAPHVIISTPEAQADRMPSVAEIMAAVEETPMRDLAPRDAAREVPDALMERPDPAKVVNSRDVVDRGDSLFDPIRVEFENGVTVIINANDIAEGQVLFQGGSRGGLSLVADDDVVDGLYAADVVMASGVADFDASDLDRILAGTDIELDAWLEPYGEHFDGRAATADIEVLLQYIHLLMTEPRVDDVALAQVVSRTQPVVDDPSSDADLAAYDALLDVRYPDQLRYASLPTPEQFATLDLDGVRRVWTERFGNAGDWTFVFSGDLDIDTTIQLAASYLGSLPAGLQDAPLDVGSPPPTGVVRTSTVAGTGDSASLTMLFTSPVGDVTAVLRATAEVATEVISARLLDVIREELGDSYSPSAFSFVTLDPDPVIETYVSITGSPDRVAVIGDLVAGEFAQLAAEGPGQEEFANAFATVEEEYRFVDNWTFANELLDGAVEPALELDDYLALAAALPNVSAEEVQDFVAAYVPADQYIQVTVTPK
jgi:zinc protease